MVINNTQWSSKPIIVKFGKNSSIESAGTNEGEIGMRIKTGSKSVTVLPNQKGHTTRVIDNGKPTRLDNELNNLYIQINDDGSVAYLPRANLPSVFNIEDLKKKRRGWVSARAQKSNFYMNNNAVNAQGEKTNVSPVELITQSSLGSLEDGKQYILVLPREFNDFAIHARLHGRILGVIVLDRDKLGDAKALNPLDLSVLVKMTMNNIQKIARETYPGMNITWRQDSGAVRTTNDIGKIIEEMLRGMGAQKRDSKELLSSVKSQMLLLQSQ